MISVGHDTNPAIIYTYLYNNDNSLTSDSVLPILESRAYDYHMLDGKFYIGSGIGIGDEYSGGSGSSGAVYLFDDGNNTDTADIRHHKIRDDEVKTLGFGFKQL